MTTRLEQHLALKCIVRDCVKEVCFTHHFNLPEAEPFYYVCSEHHCIINGTENWIGRLGCEECLELFFPHIDESLPELVSKDSNGQDFGYNLCIPCRDKLEQLGTLFNE